MPPSVPSPSPRVRLLTRPLIALLLFRILNALCVRTFHVADEFWQGPEVAHSLVHGYGHRAWEWRARVRSFVHPSLYALVYAVGDYLGFRSDRFVRWAPRWTHAVLAAAHDAGCGRLALRTHGREGARLAVALRVMHWFAFYCETRSLSNCVEACATTWALVYWPSDGLGTGGGGRRRRTRALGLAAVACAMRPTSAVLWLALGVRAVVWGKEPIGARVRFALAEAAPVGALALGVVASVDRYFYGVWTCAPWNFIKFNLLSGKSAIYGAHAWHWYLTQGYPAVMGTMLPLALIGFWRNRVTKPEAFLVTFWTIFGYSFAAHKEFRFLLPCLSASIVSAASVLKDMSPGRRRLVLAFLALTNAPAALYLSVRHQAGTIAVMPIIARLAKEGAISDGGVLFATPCHQTPFYSHVHREIRMSFLDCSPDVPPGEDESARFAADPEAYLNERYGPSPRESARECAVAAALAPNRIVLFDGDAERASAWLARWRFALESNLHHADFRVDREIQRRVHLYARPPSSVDDVCGPST